MTKMAVFLDRDGTLNVEKGYVHRIDDWEWIPGAIESILSLKKLGFLVVVVTNQAGIARGYYSESDMHKLHEHINQELKKHSTCIDAFYHCPHHAEFGKIRDCECRKPLPGMIEQAKSDLDIDLTHSWLIGDKISDIQAGMAAGVKSILVQTGYGHKERHLQEEAGICVEDIVAASNYIIARASLNSIPTNQNLEVTQ